jgi:beta-galactosidase
MAHGGTNFGFYNGANTGGDESDYKPDLTSYDYVRKILICLL